MTSLGDLEMTAALNECVAVSVICNSGVEISSRVKIVKMQSGVEILYY